MNVASIYNVYDKYIELEINRKLNQRLDELQASLLELYPDHFKTINDAVAKQRYPVQSVLRTDHEKKKRRKKQLDPTSRCMARTGLDTQCRRPRVPSTRYCQSHTYSLPYNDIEEKTEHVHKVVKKRGRRGKGKQFVTEELDQAKYVQSVVVQIGEESYLVDQHDIVYNFNHNNEIVGHIKDEQVHWF
jgi:hypothetical protein